MGFEKQYPNRKDHRKPYYGSKQFDINCRPHGDCPWCQGNREHSTKQREQAVDIEDEAIMPAPQRPTGTINVTLEYAGRAVPSPYLND